MVSVAYGPVMASIIVCQWLSSSPTFLKVSWLHPPKLEGMARKWRRFSETRNPRNSKPDPSSTTEKMYSFLWKKEKKNKLDQDRARPDHIRPEQTGPEQTDQTRTKDQKKFH